MLKAVAQESPASRSLDRTLVWVGIALAAVLPAFLLAGLDPFEARTTWATYDLLARVLLFSAPALLASLALFRRPELLIAAAISTAVALPLSILAPPLIVASVLWIIASARRPPIATWSGRQVAAALVAGVSVLAAAAIFFLAPSPLVCRSVNHYKDGTVRHADKVATAPERRAETAPYQPVSNRVSGSTTCATSYFLPERSFAVIGLVGVGLVGGTLLAGKRRPS